MVYLAWLSLIAVGIGISIIVFLWALKTGQFSDQARARYLPLGEELPLGSVEVSQRLPCEVYALIIIIALGILSIASTITLTIYWLER
jgi:cbb3-type cytochrome oxidase maturation protein